jgi:peptide-methionine (R)-S-oxide reductase
MAATPFNLTPPTAAERGPLEAVLTTEERDVLLHHGTEAPFCGGLLGQKEDGLYCCRLCGLPLFRHKTKFESGTGWPSFYEPFLAKHVKAIEDRSYGFIIV